MDVEDTPPPTPDVGAFASRIDRAIVLVGMMGVGKTSVGKRLAALLRWPFVDVDEEIEKSAKMTIPEIFATYGEAYFRDGERRVIARLIEESGGRMVIATGGGAFCTDDTRALILKQAIAVWLDSDVDTLVERTRRRDNRPLLKDGNPREIIARLMEERRPAYAQAPVRVVSETGPHSRTVAKVIRGIGEWL